MFCNRFDVFLDWDRCRRLCPIQKPKPPTAPGAQLISASEEKDVSYKLFFIFSPLQTTLSDTLLHFW